MSTGTDGHGAAMRRSRLGWTTVVALLVAAPACAGPSAESQGRLLCLGDDDLALGSPLVFAHGGYQHLARVVLPDGPHHVRRLWVLPAAAGTMDVTFYGEGELQGPTDKVFEAVLAVPAAQTAKSSHGPWSVVEVPALEAMTHAVWIGFRSKNGQPALWSTGPSSHLGGYLRSVDPQDPLELLPLKHGPVVRLDVDP